MIPQEILNLGELAVSVYQSALQAGMKSHTPSEAEALAMLAASTYTTPLAEKFTPQYAGYTEEGGDHCSSCYFYADKTCALVAVVPTGKSALYLPKAEVPNPIDQYLTKDKKSILDKIKEWINPDEPVGFKMLGNKWVAWWTNPYEDREGEWFAEKSIEADIEYMRETGDLPALWFKHLSGSKHGQASWVGKIGRFAVALGEFDDTPMAKAFQKMYQRHKGKIKMSHGFLYDPAYKLENTYHVHHTFEITTLINNEQANNYTGFNLAGEKEMPITTQDYELLVKELGAEMAQTIVMSTLKKSQELDQMGVSRKATKPPKEEMDEEEMEEADDKKPTKKSIEPVVLTRDDIVSAVTEGNKALTDQLGQLIGLLSGGVKQQQPVVAQTTHVPNTTTATPPTFVPPANPQPVPTEEKARQQFFATTWEDVTAEQKSRMAAAIAHAQGQTLNGDLESQFKTMQSQNPEAAIGMFTMAKALPRMFGGGE